MSVQRPNVNGPRIEPPYGMNQRPMQARILALVVIAVCT